MKSLVEYRLEDGTSVLVEVELPEAGAERVGLGEEIAKASQTFEAALDHACAVAQAVVRRMRGLSEDAEDVSVSFGIKVGATAGVIIASGEAEANFGVTVTWRHTAPPAAQP